MYTPLKINQKPRTNTVITSMAVKGVNLRDLAQLLNTDYAQKIQNYEPIAKYRLRKRKGKEAVLSIAGANPVTGFVEFSDNYWLFGRAGIYAAYEVSTETVTSIKTDFAANDGFSADEYGGYAFVLNGVDALQRITATLAYSGQTANFAAGDVLTGGTSGATAIVVTDADGGATGTLTLSDITGVFQNGEIITSNTGGSATVNGILTWVATAVAAAPRGHLVKSINGRLFILKDSDTFYSDLDTGANPPFQNWTVATLADSPGRVSYRNAGKANSILELGQFILVFADKGKYAFYINTIDSAGTLSKVDVFQMSRLDAGGAKGAINTPAGVFYANEAGLWQLLSVGTESLPFSDQEQETSIFLGDDYFENITLGNATLAYDANKFTVYLSCAKSSEVNNLIIAYKTKENTGFHTFSGWNINQWLNLDGIIYGASSVETKIFKCFSGYEDDGADISTAYTQELQVGQQDTAKDLNETAIQAKLSPSSVINISYDIYDYVNDYIKDKLKLQMETTNVNLDSDGYNSAAYNGSAYNGGGEAPGLVDTFANDGRVIRRFRRIILKISEQSKLPHEINWVKVRVTETALIRKRQLTLA